MSAIPVESTFVRRLSTAYSLAQVATAAVILDLSNRRAYGRGAPRYAERVWIDPMKCHRLVTKGMSREFSGHVVAGDWDLPTEPLSSLVKFRACEQHWTNGVPWEETGVYEHMMALISEHGEADGCRTLPDVVARYSRLDRMWQQVLVEGQLRSRVELHQRGFRALGEIYLHVDRNGRILFGGGGCHRLAAAQLARLKWVPAQLGVVHAQSLEEWTKCLTRSSRRPTINY